MVAEGNLHSIAATKEASLVKAEGELSQSLAVDGREFANESLKNVDDIDGGNVLRNRPGGVDKRKLEASKRLDKVTTLNDVANVKLTVEVVANMLHPDGETLDVSNVALRVTEADLLIELDQDVGAAAALAGEQEKLEAEAVNGASNSNVHDGVTSATNLLHAEGLSLGELRIDGRSRGGRRLHHGGRGSLVLGRGLHLVGGREESELGGFLRGRGSRFLRGRRSRRLAKHREGFLAVENVLVVAVVGVVVCFVRFVSKVSRRQTVR